MFGISHRPANASWAVIFDKRHSMRFTSLFTIFFTTFGWASSDSADVCVLNYERAGSGITRIVEKVFKNKPGIFLKSEATPADFLECVRSAYPEIVLIGHALELRPNSPAVNLGYFRRLDSKERAEDLADKKEYLINELTLASGSSEWDSDYSRSDRLNLELRKLEELEANDKPLYRVLPIMPRIFALARAELARQSISGSKTGLRRIRLMSCQPREVLAQYSDLREMSEEFKLELDIAPPNRVMSALKGKTVTSPSKKWLRKSLIEAKGIPKR